MFFELVSIYLPLFQIMVMKYMTIENKNWTSSKNFAPKLNLNHNIYTGKIYPFKMFFKYIFFTIT